MGLSIKESEAICQAARHKGEVSLRTEESPDRRYWRFVAVWPESGAARGKERTLLQWQIFGQSHRNDERQEFLAACDEAKALFWREREAMREDGHAV